MHPVRTPGWVVAPPSGPAAITRFGFRAIVAPFRIMPATSAAVIREYVIAWASVPKTSYIGGMTAPVPVR